MTDIIMQAYEVLDEIKSGTKFQTMKELNQKIGLLYQQEVKDFQKAKQHYDVIMQEGGTYHPDFKAAIKVFSEAKANLYQKEEVVQYFAIEKELQEEINEFLKEMTSNISSHIKTPNKLGIVQKGGSCHVR